MNILKSFGLRVKKIRTEKKISQEDLAELSGLHRTYISSLERGVRNPTLTTLISVSKGLNIEINELLQELDFD
ncbi:helix-turn-helix transcriptional regulator [Xenorhabdus bovienii]|uniref:Helix-turn-helix transcriptional regulator n=1 Tax=Xenorhabdus bovienii TaxID=40576 RepID=A0AAJ1JB17_XENBV|nr:helix-turn-helix transcriptional regulator [Xenorhabdus bovienii]MDE1480420.1 helix-turn-helix transcriptional regulator [Xenorhabdus bovienii]MDE9511987.1 helix-turn-helix transcriptional regulator [Xenorhabdus bovienii]MDE9523767.1 helix-turn-helix transcriptional regulator [Xenorhabdus bovienii]